MRRRHFLEFTAGLTLFPVVNQFCRPLLAQTLSEETITLQVYDFLGNPLSEEGFDSLYFLDLEENPLLNPPRKVEKGQLISSLPLFPIIIGIGLQVYGFGKVTLYADNQGKGYNIENFPLNLNLELARTRWQRFSQFMETGELEGYVFPLSVKNRLHQSLVYLQNAEKSLEITEQVRWCQQSLYESLWGGEEAVLAQAQERIKRRGRRESFYFGCNFFGFPHVSENYLKLFPQLFNYATLPFYWRTFEPTKGNRDYQRINQMLDWLEHYKITPKGHPLVWLAEYGIPDWLDDISFESMKVRIEEHIREVTQYFSDRISYYDIINEGSGLAFANVPGYSTKELIELSKVTALASYQGNPKVFRIINNCCLWAKYRTTEETNPDTPYQYIQACIKKNIPFEAIGLQLYYPNHDLLEIDRLLERFGAFGKVIHITELGIPSDTTEDENSFMKIPFGLWHKPWSETIQADWIEQFYTLCYSKAYIKAVTWWDFSDEINHFWAHGGLLRKDGQPKEAFYRLQTLLNHWQNLS